MLHAGILATKNSQQALTLFVAMTNSPSMLTVDLRPERPSAEGSLRQSRIVEMFQFKFLFVVEGNLEFGHEEIERGPGASASLNSRSSVTCLHSFFINHSADDSARPWQMRRDLTFN